MKQLIALCFFFIFLFGCDAKKFSLEEFSARDQAIAEMREKIKVPESAKFGKFSIAGPNFACLTINAKNGYGGYSGDQQAVLAKSGQRWIYARMADPSVSHESCLEIHEK